MQRDLVDSELRSCGARRELIPQYFNTCAASIPNEVQEISINSNPFSVNADGFCILYHDFRFHRRLGWITEFRWIFERPDFQFFRLSLPFLFLRLCSYRSR